MIATQQQTTGSLVRTILRGNAGFCFVSGLLLVLAKNTFSSIFGVGTIWMVGTGIVLMVYAADLAWALSRPAWLPLVARIAIALDIVWVVGSLVLIFGGWLELTSLGWAVMIAQMVIVAGLAEAQFLALRRATR